MYSFANCLGKFVASRINVFRMNRVCFEMNSFLRFVSNSVLLTASNKGGGGPILDFPDMGPPIPEYQARENETMEQKKARLFYQSR